MVLHAQCTFTSVVISMASWIAWNEWMKWWECIHRNRFNCKNRAYKYIFHIPSLSTNCLESWKTLSVLKTLILQNLIFSFRMFILREHYPLPEQRYHQRFPVLGIWHSNIIIIIIVFLFRFFSVVSENRILWVEVHFRRWSFWKDDKNKLKWTSSTTLSQYKIYKWRKKK